MNFSVILGIVMTLLSKREELTKIVIEAIALFNKIRAVVPELGTVIDTVVAQPAVPAGGTTFTIQWLQESLNKLTNAGLTVDGDYGTATKEAVKKFQAAHPPLVADGWAGVMTQAEIIKALH